jgi:putative flavoprotein involved in K+ transport
VRYLLVDSNPEVGAAWRSRWNSLRLFSPAQYDGLPGSEFPAAADTYPGKDDVAGFLASYAEHNAFPILTGTAVTRMIDQAAGFAVHTTQGTIAARQVVVATGAFQQPYVPALSRSLAGVPQLHSAAYRRPADLPPGRVLVVGAASSGLQVAEDLLASHAVTVAVGASPPSVPQRIAGRDIFWWLTRLGLMNKGPDSLLATRMRARGELVIGTSRRALAATGVDFRPRLVAASGRRARFADGTAIQPDAVIWATGYRPDYTWIDIPAVTGPDGRPRHEHGRSRAAAGLWFLGLPWQHTRGSALLGWVKEDAAYISQQINAFRPAALTVEPGRGWHRRRAVPRHLPAEHPVPGDNRGARRHAAPS